MSMDYHGTIIQTACVYVPSSFSFQVGYNKFTLLHSPVRRYGTITSNNVESVNARLRKTRCLPICELLVDIEEKVATDRLNSLGKANIHRGGRPPSILTAYANDLLNAARERGIGYIVLQTDVDQFKVSTPRPYQVSLASGGSCSCGAYRHSGLPCSHLLAVLIDQKIEETVYCCPSWHNAVVREAYRVFLPTHPVSLCESLRMSPMLPPTVAPKRGRPRIESQRATQDLEAAPKRSYRCAHCNQTGHNRRSCPVPHTQQPSGV